MCPDEQLLSEYLDDELNEPWRSQILEHVEWCPVCKQRLGELQTLKKISQKAILEEEKVEESEKRVLKYMDKNILNKDKQSLGRKLLSITKKKVFWPILSAALTFCFCLIIFSPSSGKDDFIPYPNVSTTLEADNIIPIRTADNYTTSETLKKYSLEDILQYLDDSGYEVTIRNKSLVPLGSETEIHTIIIPPEPVVQEASFKVYFPFKFNFGKSE